MNQRNVEALEMILRTCNGTHPYGEFDAHEVAVVLAADGVLVPSALTNLQAYSIPSAFESHPLSVKATVLPGPAEAIREALERIAKGES